MVSYSDLFLFGTLIIGVISLCYEIFHKKKVSTKTFYFYIKRNTAKSPKVTVFLNTS